MDRKKIRKISLYLFYLSAIPMIAVLGIRELGYLENIEIYFVIIVAMMWSLPFVATIYEIYYYTKFAKETKAVEDIPREYRYQDFEGRWMPIGEGILKIIYFVGFVLAIFSLSFLLLVSPLFQDTVSLMDKEEEFRALFYLMIGLFAGVSFSIIFQSIQDPSRRANEQRKIYGHYLSYYFIFIVVIMVGYILVVKPIAKFLLGI